MRIQYIITDHEIEYAKKRMERLRQAALASRDAGEYEDSREFYLKAKGFEDALLTLGILNVLQRREDADGQVVCSQRNDGRFNGYRRFGSYERNVNADETGEGDNNNY